MSQNDHRNALPYCKWQDALHPVPRHFSFLLTNCVDGFWGSCSPKFVDCISISFSLCHVTSPDNLFSRRSMSISRAKVVLTLGLMLSRNGISLVDTIFVIPWSQRLSIWVSSTFLQGVVRAQGRRNLFGWLNLSLLTPKIRLWEKDFVNLRTLG